MCIRSIIPIVLLAWWLSSDIGLADERPNVVIFLTDDQGTLDAGCYGSDDLDTPNLDALAASGVRFTQAYAHTVCCPARAMLLTGRAPQRSGVNRWTQGNAKGPFGVNMDLKEITLAEVLKSNGYRTALFGKWHLGAAFTHGPTKQGFDEFFGIRDGFIDNYNHYFLHGSGFHDLYRGTEEVFMPGEYFPDLVVKEAVQFLESRAREKQKPRPFFLYVAFNVPHYPEQADPKFDTRYADLPMPRRSYAKIVSTTDDRIGQILDKLDALKLRENSIVIQMSDNGHSEERNTIRVDNHTSGLPKGHDYGANGGGGNTGKWRGAKGTFYEGGLRVPAIVSFPKRLPRGVVRDQAITACDWYPTVLELCDIKLPNVELDGRSLLDVIHSAEVRSPHDELHWQWFDRWAVRQGDWKLIVRPRKQGRDVFLGTLVGEHPESENLARKHPEIVERLTALHEAWIDQVMPSE